MEEGQDVVDVRVVLDEPQDASRRLEVSGTGLADKDGMTNVQSRRLRVDVVVLLVHEDEGVVSEAEDLLPRGTERA